MEENKNGKSKMEEIANKQREELMKKNVFNENSQYSSTHTYALSDDETPIHGKGTGVYLDVYGGGGKYDIEGDGKTPGSGRKGNLSFNTYTMNNQYEKPNTDSLGGIVY